MALLQTWPGLLPAGGQGGQTCGPGTMAPSAFKPNPAAGGMLPMACPNSGFLPMPSSCAKEAGTGMLMSHHGAMTCSPSSAAAAPVSHTSLPPSQPVCPPYPHHSPPVPVDDRLMAKENQSMTSMSQSMSQSMAHSMSQSMSQSMAHPAFPVSLPMSWLQHSNSYNISHLQQVLNHEKALIASQYLDPFAKAANPFLDFSRMGHYPIGKKLFGCPQCRYITDRKNNLKRHIATMHQECDKVLECCGVVFKNKASLRDHVLIFHSNGYMCRFCGRNFCRKALLKRHLTVHSGQKDYTCGLCDYATSHKSNLERHKKVHERGESGDEGDGASTGHDVMKPAPRRHHGHSTDSDDEDDDDLRLSPVDVEDNDSNALIDVVDLPVDIQASLHH